MSWCFHSGYSLSLPPADMKALERMGNKFPGVPRLLPIYVKKLKGRCREPRVRIALAYAMTGESLRDVASIVGCHHSTVAESLKRYGLHDAYMLARLRRLRRESGGSILSRYSRYFQSVA